MAVSLDNRNKVISVDIISIGTLNSSLIHPRETFEIAIKNHAALIIICHNHPSGELEPSKDDLTVTQNLVKAGELLGIEIADHLIITKDNYFSFKEKGLIKV
jgi:DNA repair protein RadC